MAEHQLPLPGSIVKKSNALARAAWAIKSVYEPRLVALVASKVHVDDKDFQSYEIPIKELLGESFDGRTYQLVSDVVDNLMGRILTIQKEKGWTKYVIFSRCEYDGDKGCIRARFDPDLKEHFLGLKSHFTQYSLMEFLLLPSIYSQRIFEILKSWDDKPEVTISISDLHEILEVPSSLRANFKDFRRRVLDKAHKDITQNTSFIYEWEPIKKGRAVSSIKFIFSNLRQKTYKTKKIAASTQKESQRNNRLFIAALNCYESGECRYKEKSKKCAICKNINSR